MDTQNIKKRKRGPAPDPENRRHTRVSVYLSESEREALLKKVDKKDLSEFMRNLALKNKMPVRTTVPEINLKAYRELARTASNLNQLTKHLNTGGEAEAELIYELLHNFRSSLISAGE